MTSGEINLLKDQPVWPLGLKAMPAKDTVTWVTEHAGARQKDRDAVDQRIVHEFERRQGRLIDSQDDVGAYPKAVPVRRGLDIPKQNAEVAGKVGLQVRVARGSRIVRLTTLAR